jgi:hypothetical protein
MNILTRPFNASGPIAERHVVEWINGNGVSVREATGAGALLVGVCVQPGGAATQQRVDIQMLGVALVEAGAAFPIGSVLTASSDGRAIAAAPLAGASQQVLGVALRDAAAAGDFVDVLLGRGAITGQSSQFPAGGTVTANRVVKFHSTAGQVVHAAGATEASIGIALNGGAAATTIFVQHHGTALATAGAAITEGALLTADSAGRVVTAAPSAGVNNRLIGIALSSAAAANDTITIAIEPGSMQGA